MKRNRWPLYLFVMLFVFNLVCAVGQAQEMDHGQHGDQGTMAMQHESDGADDQMDHGHGKGMWMFGYEFMGMHMEGLLDGTDSVDSRDISGALPGPIKDPSKDYMMSPTEMRMDMHMFMLMYGLTNKISIMGMFSYLDNEMDMVMHMPTMDMFGDMDTNGLGDTVLEGLYSINDKNRNNLIPSKRIRQFTAFRKHLAQHGSAEHHAVFFFVRAGSQRSHAVTFEAVEGPVDPKGRA